MYNFIVNCCSKKGIKAKDKITAYLNKHGIEYKFYSTECGGHAQQLAAEIESSGGKDIITIGGDGMFHETLNGLQDPSAVNLGFIPSGSGNDFAKGAGIYTKNILKSLKRILLRNIQSADYIQLENGLRCLNVAGTGLDIEVLKKTLAIRRLRGKPKYLYALIRVLKNFESYNLTVERDGVVNDYECLLVSVCNGQYFGGGMKISPKSDIRNGKISLVIIKMVDRKRIKYILPKFLKGSHLDMDFCEYYEVDHVKITSPTKHKVQLDGEIYSDTLLDCRIVPKGINIFI